MGKLICDVFLPLSDFKVENFEIALVEIDIVLNPYGTIHLRRQHVLGGEGSPNVPMVKRSQYIRIKNPLHKHLAGMPMVGGRGQKS